MKKRSFIILVALGVLMASPLYASPESIVPPLSINGVACQEKEANYINEQNVMMVSEDVLAKEMDMVVTRDKGTFTITTPGQATLLVGKIGEKNAKVAGKDVALSTAIVEREGKVYVPLRSLVSAFGEVTWQGTTKPTEVCYDFNQFENVPALQVSETPLPYHVMINSGVGFPLPEKRFLGSDKNGVVVFGKLDKEKNITAIEGLFGLLEPVHEGYSFVDPLIGQEQVTWIEYKRTGDDEDWYLYTKSLDKDSAPVCLEKAEKNLKVDLCSHYLFHNVQMQGDYIAYPFYNREADTLEVRLYQISSQKTTVLDELPLKDTRVKTEYRSFDGGMEVALSATDVVWSKAVPTASGKYYKDLYHYDIKNDKKTALFQGCNVETPLLINRSLIVGRMQSGQTFMEMDLAQRELWIYDLNTNQWVARINKETAKIQEGDLWLYRPLCDQYMTFDIEKAKSDEVPVVDVEKGILYRAVNPVNGEVLRGGNAQESVLFVPSPREKTFHKASRGWEEFGEGLVESLVIDE